MWVFKKIVLEIFWVPFGAFLVHRRLVSLILLDDVLAEAYYLGCPHFLYSLGNHFAPA